MKRNWFIAGALLVALAGIVLAQQNPFFVVQDPRGVHITAGTVFPSVANIGHPPSDGQQHIDLAGGAAVNPVVYIYSQNAAAWIPTSPVGVGIGTVPSTLATNAVDVANSVWGGTNQLIFESTTADANEVIITAADTLTGDVTATIPIDNAQWAGAGTFMFSTLATNAPEAANSIWGASNALVFEGATQNGFELSVAPADVGQDLAYTLPDIGAATGSFIPTTLATNNVDVANSVTGGTNQLIFEGATGADTFQMILQPEDPVAADRTWTIPDYDAAAAFVGSTLATNAPTAATSVWLGANTIFFEGATGADGFELQLQAEDPVAADRVVTIPDYDAASATVHSLLATNAPDANNSIWLDTNIIVFEGATGGDAFETFLQAQDPTVGDDTYQLSDNALAADTYNLIFSLLDTNAIDIANSVWFDASQIIFEGATGANAFETILTVMDPTVGDDTYQLSDNAVAADTYNLVFSILDTNAIDANNGVWFNATNGLVWEGATGGDAFETILTAADSTVGTSTFILPDHGLAAANHGVHASNNAYLATRTYMWPPYAEVATVAHTSDVNEDLYCHRVFIPNRITVGNIGVVLENGGALAAADIVGTAIYYDADAGVQITTGTGDGTAAGLEDVNVTDVTLEPDMYRVCICTSDQTNMLFSAVAPAGVDADWELLADQAGDIIFGIAGNACTVGVPPATTGAIAADDDEQIMFVLH